MYEGPEFRHLRYFIAVAEECNMGRAAVREHVTQPTLSEQIKQLEEGLRTQLFLRNRAGRTLTATGRAFLPFAQNMLHMRSQAVEATSSTHSGIQLPLRFGYSAFIDHQLVEDALTGFCELVPDGKIEPYSDTSGRLVSMVLDGQLEAALVTKPVPSDGLFIKPICEEQIYVCLRRDDPLSALDALPQEIIGDRLRVMFARAHHPWLYDKMVRKLGKVNIGLKPSEFASSPSEMHFLVGRGKGFGIVLESTDLPPNLVKRSITGVSLKISTAFICLQSQKRPVMPILAFQISQRCSAKSDVSRRKKPVGSVRIAAIDGQKIA